MLKAIEIFRMPITRVVFLVIAMVLANGSHAYQINIASDHETSYQAEISKDIVLNTASEFSFHIPVFYKSDFTNLFMEILVLDLPSERVQQASDCFISMFAHNIFYVILSAKAP
jgi:hypothetical protein